MTLLRGCPTLSMDVSFISGMRRARGPRAARSPLSSGLPGAVGSPSLSGSSLSLSLLMLVSPLASGAAGARLFTASSGLIFFFLPVFFFLANL